MDKIYLSCSFYPSEQEIELYSEHPIYKATDIRDDILIFEDACYSGRVKLDKEERDVEKILVLLDESYIGGVEFECKDTIEGVIRFKEQVEGISQPFLLQCDLVSLGLKIMYKDGSVKYLYSQYLLCASKNEEDNENTENMLKELLLYDDDKVNSWIFGNKDACDIQNGLVEGALREKSYRSVMTYIQLLRQIVGCYKEYFLYFKHSAKHSVTPVKKTIDYTQIHSFGQGEFKWLIKNMDQLSPVDINTSIKIGGVNYLPLKVMAENRQLNFNVYENQVLISFLKKLIDEAQQICIELHKTIVTEENIYNRLRRTPPKGYYAPIITVKQIQNKYLRIVQSDLENAIMEMRKVFQMYYRILPVDSCILTTLPKRTKAFQEIIAYSRVYGMIVKWFEFGEISLEREKVIFRVKTVDKLYEYYCLHQLIKMLSEEGFAIYDVDEDVSFFKYKVEDSKYKNEVDVANTYKFRRDNESITLYYQPVIFSDGYSNELNLFRTTKKDLYYTPDFVLKLVNNKKESYVILDSKYANRSSIIRYRLKECVWNYGVEIEPCGDDSEIKMVWLLQGRIDDSRMIYTLHNSPNFQRCRHIKSYGIISVNTKINSRQKLWNEIIKVI